MNSNDQIKALAELDGWVELEVNKSNTGLIGYRYSHKYAKLSGKELIPPYLTSLDAIVPVIEKQDDNTRRKISSLLSTKEAFKGAICDYFFQTASNLSEALLRATGKWKDL